jgi:hypothetical protein
MKVLFSLIVFFCLTGCYFGANESGEEIVNNCYLARWDYDAWISYSKDGDDIWDPDKIIVSHNVFAVADHDDFIVAKQHPCGNKLPHIQDYDSLTPDRTITNYIIIDTRHDTYVVHSYDNEKDYNEAKILFDIPKDLTYKFHAKEID